MQEFITNFADQFDETDPNEITANTEFHNMEEWSSLVGLAVLNMIARKYNVRISPADLRNAETVKDVYNLVVSAK